MGRAVVTGETTCRALQRFIELFGGDAVVSTVEAVTASEGITEMNRDDA